MEKNSLKSFLSTMTIIILAFLMIYLSLQLVFLQNDLESSYTKIDALKIQDEKTLLNPTKDQIIQFLRQDKTDEKEYIKGKYVCTHFSKQLIYNATLAGLNAHYVQIKFSDLNSGHAMVGFQTLDSGFIFVEPQSDEIKDIYIGKKRGNNTISAIHISK